ncbi:Gfo/Idh/MocA family protein [Ahrensia kielensis]|uniref:Gfo/Idh/MocA family protein n=1 Tax=Ahrensia kielensis TaxID=76980 RepID=UPI00037008F9|nr:Gfo/Idh/MocA family oxidoreductase [Ahrensia kielensis]
MNKSTNKVRVLVVGLGNMGLSHALAYHHNDGYEIVALVNRSERDLPADLQGYEFEKSYPAALKKYKPDLVSINTYSDTHADYAIAAMEAGCDVFVEKPLANTVSEAQKVVSVAKKLGRKLVVGYILRHHPSWITFVDKARELGGPFVFRLNLNQQSSGDTWKTHKRLMETTSPIVDCGVHYVDVMCQIANSDPVSVRGIGLRLSDEIAEDMYNYGHFQVTFKDGSIGWYEAGWGPMMSQTAFFVKDVISPNGSVSIVVSDDMQSDDIDNHTKASTIRIHDSETDAQGEFVKSEDTLLSTNADISHDELCVLEQQFVLDAIRNDVDLTEHMENAVKSLAVCLAADESIRTNKEITF